MTCQEMAVETQVEEIVEDDEESEITSVPVTPVTGLQPKLIESQSSPQELRNRTKTIVRTVTRKTLVRKGSKAIQNMFRKQTSRVLVDPALQAELAAKVVDMLWNNF